MSGETLAALLIGAFGPGLAALGVPRLIARVPEVPPTPGAEDAPDQEAPAVPRPRFAEVAAMPRLAVIAAVAAAATGLGLAWRLGWTPELLLVLPLVPLLVALAVIDARTKLLPTILVVPGTLLALGLGGVAAFLLEDRTPFLHGLIGLVAMRSLFWVLWWFRSSGMGFGDVRLAALVGFVLGFFGWPEWVVGVYAAFVEFVLPGLLLALVRRDRSLLRTRIPFGPFIMLGALTGILAGPEVMAGLGY